MKSIERDTILADDEWHEKDWGHILHLEALTDLGGGIYWHTEWIDVWHSNDHLEPREYRLFKDKESFEDEDLLYHGTIVGRKIYHLMSR